MEKMHGKAAEEKFCEVSPSYLSRAAVYMHALALSNGSTLQRLESNESRKGPTRAGRDD